MTRNRLTAVKNQHENTVKDKNRTIQGLKANVSRMKGVFLTRRINSAGLLIKWRFSSSHLTLHAHTERHPLQYSKGMVFREKEIRRTHKGKGKAPVEHRETTDKGGAYSLKETEVYEATFITRDVAKSPSLLSCPPTPQITEKIRTRSTVESHPCFKSLEAPGSHCAECDPESHTWNIRAT